MTLIMHLGDSQRPSVVFSLEPIQNVARYSGLLGNLKAQRPAIVEGPQDREFWLKLHEQFRHTLRASKLVALKNQKFTAAGREERVRLALDALNARQPTNLTMEQWKAVIEHIEDEDEE